MRLEQPQPAIAVPQPRQAVQDVVRPAALEDEDAPRLEVEALAMLASLASDFDY